MHSLGDAHGSSRRSAAILRVALLLLTPFAAQAQSPAKTPEIVMPQQSLPLALSPGETRVVQVMVPSGSALLVSVQQTLGTVSVGRVPAAAGPVRTNAAGLRSIIVLPLTGTAGASEGLAIRNLSDDKPASALLLEGPAHAEGPGDQLRAQAELALAQAERLRGGRVPTTYPEALAEYDGAIKLFRELQDDQGLARALSWKALFLFVNESDAAGALPLTQEATADLARLDPVEAGNCLKIAGYVHVQLAQYDDGRTAYLAALERFKTTGDLFNQEVLLDNLSRLERIQGNSDAALADAEQAGALANRLGDLKRQAKIESSIAAIHLTASRPEPAYAAYQRALALLAQAPDPLTEAYVWSDLGVLYTLLHQFHEAHEALDQASAIWNRTPNPAGELNTLDDLGELAIQQGKLPQARGYLRRGLALAAWARPTCATTVWPRRRMS